LLPQSYVFPGGGAGLPLDALPDVAGALDAGSDDEDPEAVGAVADDEA
jgi:hypothetical protein